MINIYNLSDKEREALGVKSLPISLNEAIKIARKFRIYQRIAW